MKTFTLIHASPALNVIPPTPYKSPLYSHSLGEPQVRNPVLIKFKRGTSHFAAWIDTKKEKGSLTKGLCPLLHFIYAAWMHYFVHKIPSHPGTEKSAAKTWL